MVTRRLPLNLIIERPQENHRPPPTTRPIPKIEDILVRLVPEAMKQIGVSDKLKNNPHK